MMEPGNYCAVVALDWATARSTEMFQFNIQEPKSRYEMTQWVYDEAIRRARREMLDVRGAQEIKPIMSFLSIEPD